MPKRVRHPLVALLAVTLVTVPWLFVRATGLVGSLSTGVVILVSGVSVVGAAFVLTWAAEAAEVDVPRSFALAVLAIIAVAPEYAVDALFAWEAGAAPGTGRDGQGVRRRPGVTLGVGQTGGAGRAVATVAGRDGIGRSDR